MVPPPAPMVLIISIGAAISQSPMSTDVCSSTEPFSPSAMSLLVPPMSNETMFENPAESAICIPASEPAHGPESRVVMGMTLVIFATPPLLCMMYSCSVVMPRPRSPSASLPR